MRHKTTLTLVAFATFVLCCSWALAAPASAPVFDAKLTKPLEGRTVLLLVGLPEATKEQKTRYWDLLKRSGADSKRYPVYTATQLPLDVATRLGVSKRPEGYAALVRWGNPGRFGPAAVLEPGIISDLQSDADIYVLVAKALEASGQSSLLGRLPDDMKHLIPQAKLVIDQVDFQANGTPHFIVVTKARISNVGKLNAKGVNVIFQVWDLATNNWFELGRHEGVEIKAGQTISRDLARTTHDTPILNDKNEVQPSRYEIRVELGTDVIEAGGEFQPLEIEDQDKLEPKE